MFSQKTLKIIILRIIYFLSTVILIEILDISLLILSPKDFKFTRLYDNIKHVVSGGAFGVT